MIDTKHLYVSISDYHSMEDSPKLYMDWFILRGNLKRSYKTYDLFQFTLGLFKYSLLVNVKWNHRERPMSVEEQERHDKLIKFFKKVEETDND